MEYMFKIEGGSIWEEWPLKPGLSYPTQKTHPNHGFYNYGPSSIRDDLLDEMKKIGITPVNVNLFYTSPGKFVPIHVDVFSYISTDGPISHYPTNAAINWSVTKFPWLMTWYEGIEDNYYYLHDSAIYKNYKNNVGDKVYRYKRYYPEKMKKVFEGSWEKNPTLIKTDIPHNVTMLEVGERWCASIRFLENSFTTLKRKIINYYGNTKIDVNL